MWLVATILDKTVLDIGFYWDEESLESLGEGSNFLLKGHMAAVLKIDDVEARS